ncbi:MAG: restriction endonuclease [bacterium]|nr:restriction endonuclease [bacterium]
MKQTVTITKADGKKELFEDAKLVNSLQNAGGGEEVIAKVVAHMGKEMHDGMTTGEIYQHAFRLLHEYSLPVAIKYSLRRALSELGPDGFPFEKYVARIFQEWGYETLVGQAVFGGCVSHEVDVVAWDMEKLVMVEAKFHNEFLLKSDLKVVLYIKARFDDLKENTYDFGGVRRRLDEGWLVTNTKFTDQAIKYAECKGLKLLGWNYPKEGNLQNIIESLRLYPFTCLISLSNVHKKALLEKGVILCRDIADHPEYLNEIGMSDEGIKRVKEEIRSLNG